MTIPNDDNGKTFCIQAFTGTAYYRTNAVVDIERKRLVSQQMDNRWGAFNPNHLVSQIIIDNQSYEFSPHLDHIQATLYAMFALGYISRDSVGRDEKASLGRIIKSRK